MTKRVYRFLVDGKPVDQETMNKWLQANGYDTNFARKEDVAERAAATITTWVNNSQKAKQAITAKWDVIDYMMRGQSLADLGYMQDGGVHVPEIRKRIDVMAPRIVRALGGSTGEVFECSARIPEKERSAAVNEEWLRYQLDLSGYLQGAEERVRSGLTYGTITVSTGWKAIYRKQMVRTNRKEATKDGAGYVSVFEDELKEILAYEGFDWHLVDPRWVIWDPRSVDPRDPTYAGEYMEPHVSDLLMLEANGIISGVVDAIEGKRNTKAKGALNGIVEDLRQASGQNARDGDRSQYITQVMRKLDVRTADRVPTISVFGKWSEKEKPTDACDWGSWQFMYVNDVPVRVARSPHDAQHIPLATCRMCADPFRFWGISPAMSALNQSIEYDQHRSAMSRLAQLKANPLLAAKPGSNLPESIASLIPGQVIEGEFSPIGIPGSLSDSALISDVVRRDIMESMGAPEGYTGTSNDGTATQYMGNIQEADNRIRQMTLNVAQMDLTVIQHCALVSKQFVTDNKKFRVLGRHAKLLGAGAELRPEDLLDPVDITMIGPRDFASHGARASRLTTFFTTAAPLLTNLSTGGRLDTEEMVKQLYVGIVGQRLSDRVFKQQADADTVLSPEQEEILLAQAMPLDPHPLDDDQDHLVKHLQQAAIAEQKDESEEVRVARYDHIAKTIGAIKSKQAQQQAQMRMQMAQQMAAEPAVAASDGRNAPGEGRTYQRPPDFGTGPADQAPGQSPGPATPARMAQPDRAATIPQTVP